MPCRSTLKPLRAPVGATSRRDHHSHMGAGIPCGNPIALSAHLEATRSQCGSNVPSRCSRGAPDVRFTSIPSKSRPEERPVARLNRQSRAHRILGAVVDGEQQLLVRRDSSIVILRLPHRALSPHVFVDGMRSEPFGRPHQRTPTRAEWIGNKMDVVWHHYRRVQDAACLPVMPEQGIKDDRGCRCLRQQRFPIRTADRDEGRKGIATRAELAAAAWREIGHACSVQSALPVHIRRSRTSGSEMSQCWPSARAS